MTPHSPGQLTAIPTTPGQPDYEQLLTWPFASVPFYVGQVTRLLENDLRQRVLHRAARVWVYQNPHGKKVGFGSLHECDEYARFTGGMFHCYIPLLAVHPNFFGQGHGRAIVEHLIGEAALTVESLAPDFSNNLFLDVYAANAPAISLYRKCGFEVLNPNTPILDPLENNETYVVMAKNVEISGWCEGPTARQFEVSDFSRLANAPNQEWTGVPSSFMVTYSTSDRWDSDTRGVPGGASYSASLLVQRDGSAHLCLFKDSVPGPFYTMAAGTFVCNGCNTMILLATGADEYANWPASIIVKPV